MTSRAALGERGAVLAGVLMALLLLMIFIPPMVVFVQNEAVQTVKQKRATTAFYAAMAGVDRVLYHLKSSTATFDDVLDGNPPGGYKFDQIYTDIPTGAYTVAMASTSTKAEIVVYSHGRDPDAKEFRRIEVKLKRDSVVAAIYSPGVSITGSAKIFWGPAMSKTNMSMTGSANELYPRKFARGSITATGGYATRDASSAAPNTDGIEWWSYNEPPGVPDALDIDLDYYREQAKAQAGCPAGGSPAGSCYYLTAQQWSNPQSETDKTYFFESDAKFTGSKHLRGFMVVMGNLTVTGSGYGTNCGNCATVSGYGCYVGSAPATAYLEYQKNVPAGGDDCRTSGTPGGGGGNGAADDGNYNNGSAAERDDEWCHQYPADHGYRSTETYKFGYGCCTHGNIGGGDSGPIHFKGYIWVKGATQMTGSTVVHGSFSSDSGSFTGTGSMIIYFDDTLEVQVKSVTITQTSWQELPSVSF